MRCYDLTDEQWAAVAPLLPIAQVGRPRHDDRTSIDGVLWKLCSGAPWRAVPKRYGPWQTVYYRFAHYRDDGTLGRILQALQLRLDSSGHVDLTTLTTDRASLRTARAAVWARRWESRRGRPGKCAVGAEEASARRLTSSGSRPDGTVETPRLTLLR